MSIRLLHHGKFYVIHIYIIKDLNTFLVIHIMRWWKKIKFNFQKVILNLSMVRLIKYKQNTQFAIP